MKRIIVVLIVIVLSCQKKKEKSSGYVRATLTDTAMNVYSPQSSYEMVKTKYLKNDSLSDYPVKIISTKLFKNQYSTFKNIRLTFKNVSRKNIHAIKFQWYTENALAEPSNLRSFFNRGESSGLYTADLLKPGKTSSVIFEEFSSDAKRVIAARPYEVVFSDGTKWYIKNQSYLDIYLIKR
ncbi:hypothetical protein [Flavobacterium sp. ENC]|uniref:hypothetical protein n=1 Tax=Flavobacterium sp. ENC TaxID=2897330 RepID=UPI001E44F74E|nr:hypothetical protein [Flavobacterium sp. ENC]MCD0467185.1 hypothetical protein [Flavobacterium sp. ENC]